jgi:hypothetical protein
MLLSIFQAQKKSLMALGCPGTGYVVGIVAAEIAGYLV